MCMYFSPVVDGFILFYQVGICCVYVVFVASNIKEIVDNYWIDLDVRIYMTMLLIPLILMLCVKNLKLLAPFSLFANVLILVGLAIVLYYIFDGIRPPSERNAVGKIGDYPLFFGTTLFALESVGVVISVESNMKTPKAYDGYFGVLNQSMTVIVVMYVVFGLCGYLRYGADCEGSITLNLPKKEL